MSDSNLQQEVRRALGLASVSAQWGTWEDVEEALSAILPIVAEHNRRRREERQRQLELDGLVPVSPVTLDLFPAS